MHDYLTTREVAEYLRLGERKIYDLVAEGRIPFARVTGKLLFPRRLVDQWVIAQVVAQDGLAPPSPPVIAGSHDPLLDWASRESGCDLAVLACGSTGGLRRLGEGGAMVAATHVFDPATGEYNVTALRREVPTGDVVLIEWAHRSQGLAVAAGNPLGLAGISDALECGSRLALRQPGAGAQLLLEHLARQAGCRALPGGGPVAHTESDLAAMVAAGKADCGLCVEAVARPLGLDFLPLAWERLDLAMRRRDYFEPAVQSLLAFARTPAFAAKAEDLGGYDIATSGRVSFNP